MVTDTSVDTWSFTAPIPELKKRIKELEAENARLRQQRDAANAQLDFILNSEEEPQCRRVPNAVKIVKL